MNLIVAVNEAWGIDRDGGLLTYLPGDVKYFRETIRGKIVVMGGKTLGSFPDAKPLKSRVNIVLTQSRGYCPEGVTVCHDVNEVLEILERYPEGDIPIVGKGMTYREFLPYCEKAYVTYIHGILQADTKFVDSDREEDWEWERVSGMQKYNGLVYGFRIHTRRQQE